MELTAVDARLLDLPLVEPFAASHGTTTSRTVVVVRVVVDGSEGWGECSALPAATYTAESATGAYRLLTDQALPRLIQLCSTGPDDPAGPDPLDGLRQRHPKAPMALASIEMALIDAHLTATGRSLATHLGAGRRLIPAGVSLGLDRPEAVLDRARQLVADGYRRLKVKIEPGHDRSIVDGLRADPAIAADVELHLDANGAYGPADLDLLVGLIEAGADGLEQPLAPTEVDASAQLVRRLAALAAGRARKPAPVVADEAVTTDDDLRRLAGRSALTGLSIKPARVGGIEPARRLHDRCLDLGLAATAGGMLETGLGRHALAAVAALPGFGLTGDLSPAARWLAADPWPDLALDRGHIPVPDGPGVAPPPDPELLSRFTVEHWRGRP